jgi:diamine N-acetyltransferase
MAARLRLEPVTRENVRAACGLRLRPDQQDLVAPVAWSLADAYVAPDIAWPRVVYDGDLIVGFLMAAFDLRNPSDIYHSYLWRLSIAAGHQRSGYGRFAVDGLCKEARRRGQRRLTVSYHPARNGPEGFFLRMGFIPTLDVIQDEVVAERIFSNEAVGPAAASE